MGGLCKLLLIVLLAALWGSSPAAAAERIVPAKLINCHAQSDTHDTLDTMLASANRWICQDKSWSPSQPVSWLQIASPAWRGQPLPREFVTRITRFKTITLIAADGDGTRRTVRYTPDQARTVPGGPLFSLDLPRITPATRAVFARIEEPHNATVLSEARVFETAEKANWTQSAIMLMALVAGMLITPLIFDINFYVVLRERFVLLHALMVTAMLSYLLFSGGLITVFVVLPVTFLAIAGPLCWAMGVASAAFFSLAFLEPHALSARMRRIVAAAGWWTLAVPGFCSLQLSASQSFDNLAYFLGFVPVIAIYVLAMAQALSRGSHAARFLAAAWLPIIASATERLLRGMGLYSASPVLDQMLFVALGLEVLIIALGVFNRFIALKLERDRATRRASLLENAAQRDPLTGLLNRRAIEPNFATLREAGFCALAVIDLDFFKLVNDRHGHGVGDRVLRLVAEALQAGDDVLVARMGGEEFALLLRGPDVVRRAEQRRQAIPTRIATAEPGLERLVTASMGLIEFPAEMRGETSFAAMYAAADRLLYEAKNAGRNRTVRERMQLFGTELPRRKVAEA